MTRSAGFRATEGALREVPPPAEEARTGPAPEYPAAEAFAAPAWPVAPGPARRARDRPGLPAHPVREAGWPFLPCGTRCASAAPGLAAEAVPAASGRS
ncbi:hypothetical protein LUX01_04640 [Streptomyces sudanensis]|uniref:hypothetical protein n=1 Tax=Streptomyces sudanensis TaxID=436397 RepID=UPI0020CDA93F|nr:hypothetical protein [Streptomyces sudanensis]MCP9986113.1 hypothetical protein [Streptomyces sudanensis]